MTSFKKSRIPEIVNKYQTELLADWIKEQSAANTLRQDLLKASELQEQSERFIRLFSTALQSGKLESISGPEWSSMRSFLDGVSRTRAVQGFSPAETATFVFSIKQPLFGKIHQENSDDATTLAEELWTASFLLDKLGLHTTTAFQKTREDMIVRQQEEMLELSTPVIKLWDGILALPMIGTLDSARTQVVMETLLQRIVETGSEVAIIDITGVPTILKNSLASSHHPILECTNAKDGIQRARSDQPKIIFLDLSMPGMNGFEALKALKADPATRAIPVVINTSRVLTEKERRELDQNALAVISKEMRGTGEQVVAQLCSLLQKAGLG